MPVLKMIGVFYEDKVTSHGLAPLAYLQTRCLFRPDESSVSRVRPVCMAALTTMRGMLPLLSDPFFMSMAVTIVFGLGFATVLTLIVLPVAYTLIIQNKSKPHTL